jgi:hypothetical protein
MLGYLCFILSGMDLLGVGVYTPTTPWPEGVQGVLFFMITQVDGPAAHILCFAIVVKLVTPAIAH